MIARTVIALFLISHSSTLLAQWGKIPLNNEYEMIILNGQVEQQYNFHTSIKPYLAGELDSLGYLISKSEPEVQSKFLRILLNSDTTKPQKDQFNLAFAPLVQAMYGIGSSNDSADNSYSLGLGMHISGFVGERLTFGFDYLYSNNRYADYIQNQVYDRGVVPALGKADVNGEEVRTTYYSTYLAYEATDYLRFEGGIGKNFIGNGYRSLLLSDNSFVYPYLNITLNIWKLKYQVLYTKYDFFNYSTFYGYTDQYRKFSTSNFLSMNIGKKWNVGLFQKVIWYDDPETKRGFDVNYLNPVIFLRPVEYSIGSPDNVLMGLDFKFNFIKKNALFGQIILDEFLLKEVRDNNGWWGNKYGFQLGLKFYDLLKLKGLSANAEYNWVRPFTYSHSNPAQNYSHANAALAHPLGANFSEAIFRLSYGKKRWLVSLHTMVADIGEDYPNISGTYGSDIFRSNSERFTEYGNSIGQGVSSFRLFQQLKFSYLISADSKWMFEFGISNRMAGNLESTDAQDGYKRPFERSVMLQFGIKTALYNQYLDF